MYDSFDYNAFWDAASSAMESSSNTVASANVAPAALTTKELAGFLGVIFGIGLFMWLIIIALTILVCVARWKMFKKAGVDGWESLIPVHNVIVEMKLGKLETYWYFLNLIVIFAIGPIVLAFWKNIRLAKAFGKSAAFGVFLLTLLPFIGYPMLGFGKAEYVGEKMDTPVV